MDQERSVDIEQVTRAMDLTRQSIQATVEEIKDRVSETADWRHYVGAYPVASLAVAMAGGLVLARLLVPAMRLPALLMFLVPRIARRSPAPPSGVAALLARVSTAAGIAGQLANVPAVVAQVRQVVGRRSGIKRRRA